MNIKDVIEALEKFIIRVASDKTATGTEIAVLPETVNALFNLMSLGITDIK